MSPIPSCSEDHSGHLSHATFTEGPYYYHEVCTHALHDRQTIAGLTTNISYIEKNE